MNINPIYSLNIKNPTKDNKNSSLSDRDKILKEHITIFALDIKKAIGKDKIDVLNGLNTIEKEINQLGVTLKRDHIITCRKYLNKLIGKVNYNQNIEDFFKCCIILSKYSIKKLPDELIQSYLPSESSQYFPVINNISSDILSNIYSKLYMGMLNLTNDFRGYNLSKMDLKYITFSYANFSGADFSGSDVSMSNFSHSNFSGANFTDADVSMSNFSHSNFSGANFTGADVSMSNFIDVYLHDTNLKDADLNMAKIRLAFYEPFKLNFINDEQSTNILAIMNSIDDRYINLKNELMIQIFEYNENFKY